MFLKIKNKTEFYKNEVFKMIHKPKTICHLFFCKKKIRQHEPWYLDPNNSNDFPRTYTQNMLD
jgi:hypothetical protein